MQLTERFCSVPPILRENTLGVVRGHPPLFPFHQPRERTCGSTAIKPQSDEAHFWLNGYVNKQNCRIWSEADPQVYVETPLHPEKLTVWCALWTGGIIGPYFFKNDEGHNVTVNGDRYRAMITNFFIPELNNHDVFRSCGSNKMAQQSLVYADKPQTLDHLEDNIRRVIADIQPQMLEKVIENWTSRLDYIRASRGSTMPEIIFKM
ncbi:transposase [Trichonephila clavipes]|nr:transposase [Trichonephila clavipes]